MPVKNSQNVARQSWHLPLLLLLLGLVIRLWLARAVFLNPDEALHYLLSLQPSLAETYRATLTTAHPPLYIVFLHYWGFLGRSELFLRLPSLLMGIAFCWTMFLWLDRVVNRTAALIGLSLLLFSPAMIYVSAEVRQYAMLLFFCAGALYFLDSALIERSLPRMLLSSLCLWFALLVHYSAFLFAFTLGVYALVRLIAAKPPVRLVVTWAVAQLTGLAIGVVLFRTQISLLQNDALPKRWADTYLRGSIFHSVRDTPVSFVFKSSLQLCHYLFSQGAVGVVGLLLFITALVLLWRKRERPVDPLQPSSRQLAFLLTFPLVVNCALGLAGKYPYGGSRHDAYLALFVMPGVAVALARWQPSRRWVRPLVIGLVLLGCNLFPSHAGQYMRLKDQRKEHMLAAVSFLQQSVPPGSVVLTDNQGALLLSYYLCHDNAVPLLPPYSHYFDSPCGRLTIVSLDPRVWMFYADTLPDELRTVQRTYGLAPRQTVWLVEATWVTPEVLDFRAHLPSLGCQAHDFGQNILVCQVPLPLSN